MQIRRVCTRDIHIRPEGISERNLVRSVDYNEIRYANNQVDNTLYKYTITMLYLLYSVKASEVSSPQDLISETKSHIAPK